TRGDEVGQVVPGGWLYNRSHMIGHQLSGLNDEKENLITGTKFFNNYAMLPIENFVANYIEEEDESVRFRVTPHFEGDNLLASGMFMEGLSLHDIGDEDPDIMFNIYVPNIQPGVTLNYADGSHSVGETNAVVIPTHPHAKNFDAVTPPEEDNDETAPPVEEDDNETVPPVEEEDPEVSIEEENPDTPVENDPDTPVEDEENPDAPVEEDNGETIPPVEEEDPDAPVENDPDAPVENDGDETTDNESIEEDPDAPVENDGNETTDDELIEEDVATDDELIEEGVATDDELIEEDVATEDVATDDEATLPVEEDNNEATLPVEDDNVEATLPVEEDNIETTLPVEETVTSDDQHVVSDTESTDDTASEIDTDLSTIHDGSSIQKPVVDEDVDELPETGSGAPEIGLIASAMALIIGAGLALFKRRESNNN